MVIFNHSWKISRIPSYFQWFVGRWINRCSPHPFSNCWYLFLWWAAGVHRKILTFPISWQRFAQRLRRICFSRSQCIFYWQGQTIFLKKVRTPCVLEPGSRTWLERGPMRAKSDHVFHRIPTACLMPGPCSGMASVACFGHSGWGALLGSPGVPKFGHVFGYQNRNRFPLTIVFNDFV